MTTGRIRAGEGEHDQGKQDRGNRELHVGHAAEQAVPEAAADDRTVARAPTPTAVASSAATELIPSAERPPYRIAHEDVAA